MGCPWHRWDAPHCCHRTHCAKACTHAAAQGLGICSPWMSLAVAALNCLKSHPCFSHCLDFPGGDSSGPCCTEDRWSPKYFGTRRALSSQKLQKEAKPCLAFHVYPCRKPAASRDNRSHPDGPSLHTGDELPSGCLAAVTLPGPKSTACTTALSVPAPWFPGRAQGITLRNRNHTATAVAFGAAVPQARGRHAPGISLLSPFIRQENTYFWL